MFSRSPFICFNGVDVNGVDVKLLPPVLVRFLFSSPLKKILETWIENLNFSKTCGWEPKPLTIPLSYGIVRCCTGFFVPLIFFLYMCAFLGGVLYLFFLLFFSLFIFTCFRCLSKLVHIRDILKHDKIVF